MGGGEFSGSSGDHSRRGAGRGQPWLEPGSGPIEREAAEMGRPGVPREQRYCPVVRSAWNVFLKKQSQAVAINVDLGSVPWTVG